MKRTLLISLVFALSLMINSCSDEAVHSGLKDLTPLPQPEPVPSKLTLMVYMAADNDLEAYALSNLKDMEKAVTQGVNVLVLLDRAEGYDETYGNWTDTRLFEVYHDEGSGSGSGLKSKRIACPALGLSASENTELDMANPSVLKGFIEFCKGSYAAENYALVIWGHGSGWKAFAIDEEQALGLLTSNRVVLKIDSDGNVISCGFLKDGFVQNKENYNLFETCYIQEDNISDYIVLLSFHHT